MQKKFLPAIKSGYEALAIVLAPSFPIDTCTILVQPCNKKR